MIAIISMARNLNLNVIAEGVETEEQLSFLQENGCDEIQGYLISKPVPSEEIRKTTIDSLQKLTVDV